MIDSEIIIENLNWLDEKYRLCCSSKTAFVREIVLYPRYAVLEACGWIEMAVDDVLCCIYKNKIGEEMSNVKKDLYITPVWGLGRNNFEKIFSSIVGFVNMKKIQEGVMRSNYDFLTTFVRDIFDKRNNFAHTYLQSESEPIYKTPKLLKEDIERVNKIFKEMEEILSKN